MKGLKVITPFHLPVMYCPTSFSGYWNDWHMEIHCKEVMPIFHSIIL